MLPMRKFAERSNQPIVLTLVEKWFSKDDSTGHSEKKKKKRYTEKRWEDDIKEWTGMDFASSTKAANKT